MNEHVVPTSGSLHLFGTLALRGTGATPSGRTSSSRAANIGAQNVADGSSIIAGQTRHGLIPERYDPLADVPAVEDVRRRLGAMVAAIRQGVQETDAPRPPLGPSDQELL